MGARAASDGVPQHVNASVALMVDLLQETETPPAAYPATDSDVDQANVIWPRLESWCNTRWSPRQVVWTVEGAGNWQPPLGPVTAIQAEIWRSEAWEEVFPAPSPLGGYKFACEGPYRLTATIGASPVPAAVNEAMKRLLAYLSDDSAPAGASQYKVDMAETIAEEISRSQMHMSRSLQNSGAADLLRPWRRLK